MQRWTQRGSAAESRIRRVVIGILMLGASAIGILPACGGGGGGGSAGTEPPGIQPTPDLVIESLDFSPSSAGPGDPLQVVEVVRTVNMSQNGQVQTKKKRATAIP